jgi:hypothetical protein
MPQPHFFDRKLDHSVFVRQIVVRKEETLRLDGSVFVLDDVICNLVYERGRGARLGQPICSLVLFKRFGN